MVLSIKVMTSSFGKVRAAGGNKISDKFYSLLFTRYPESKALFHDTNLEKQKQLLFNALDFVVGNLDNTERLIEYLQNLGERHNVYGADEIHFDWVGECLLMALEDVLGEDWNQEVKENWESAFGTIRDAMIQGMRRVQRANKNVVNIQGPLNENSTLGRSDPGAKNLKGLNIENMVDINSKIVADIILPENIKKQIRQIVKEKIYNALEMEVSIIMDEELGKLSETELTKLVDSFRAA